MNWFNENQIHTSEGSRFKGFDMFLPLFHIALKILVRLQIIALQKLGSQIPSFPTKEFSVTFYGVSG